MADETENKSNATPDPSAAENAKKTEADGKTAQPDGPAHDGAKTASAKNAGSQETGSKDAGARGKGGKSDDPSMSDEARKAEAFALLDKAVKAADFGWKSKAGSAERDIARQTYLNAEAAWVEAAIEDPKRAATVWRKATNKGPTADMEVKLNDAKKSRAEAAASGKAQPSVGGENIDSLNSNINELSKRRELSEQKTRKTALNSSLGEWNIMRGDSEQRAMQAKRAKSNEIWSPEPDKNSDGLHLLKSFVKGFWTHRESTQRRVENHKANLAGKAIKDIQKSLGKVHTSIKKFETDLNIPMDQRDTLGVVGRSRRALSESRTIKIGAGSARLLAKTSRYVADKTQVKKAADLAKDVAKGAIIQGAAAFANPGSIDGNPGKASYEARMAAFTQFQRNRGMGSGA